MRYLYKKRDISLEEFLWTGNPFKGQGFNALCLQTLQDTGIKGVSKVLPEVEECVLIVLHLITPLLFVTK